ncbi:MAG: hypothetical protein IJW70_02545 [Clostridia bacterium]|nr:hypothetical protein [Clostridia bacterium]
MKTKSLITGIIAALSPFPMVIFTVLWCWTIFFGIYLGALDGPLPAPDWILVVSLLPLWISPLLGVAGIVHGIIDRKAPLAWLSIVLSVVCLLGNALLIGGMAYLGSRF